MKQALSEPVSYLHILMEDDFAFYAKSKYGEDLDLEKLFDLLQIELTELESKTWKQRNIPAHGKRVENNIEYIRGVKILRTLFNRLILKISSASEYYFDYYSLGNEKSYNLRLLEDGIKDV